MSHGNPASLPWVWDWLQGAYVGVFGVPQNIQPVLDVSRHRERYELYREQFTLAAGTNSCYLPGQNRASSLNPAAGTPIPQSTSARRWLSMEISSDTAIAGGVNLILKRGSTLQTRLWGLNAVTISRMYPVIRGSVVLDGTLQMQGFPGSVYVPDPLVMTLLITGAAGGEVVTVQAAVIDAEDSSEPLPDLFSP